ncbi:MAG: xanthine dehydrogenase family protein subunit M [Dehalococcoidia bacterium]|nr:xanthine dehydrogenase family protein subunit M [Dehalococcoidia bacterium]
MHAFEYVVPKTVREAVKSLEEKGDQARPIAGGTDIIVQMRVGRRRPIRVVDVKQIPDLNELSIGPRAGLRLGAAVPCYRVYQNQAVAEAYPGLIDAASMIGSIQIQGRASVGGNLCNAAPSGDCIPALIVLNATAVIAGPNGTRELPVEEFCIGPGRNALQPGELLVSLRLPLPRRKSGAHYLRFIPRNEMDIAVVGVGASVTLDGRGEHFTTARVSLASVAPTPLLVTGVEELVAGQPLTEEVFERVAELARRQARPISDMRGTIEQRRHLVGVLTKRALRTAIQRAREA